MHTTRMPSVIQPRRFRIPGPVSGLLAFLFLIILGSSAMAQGVWRVEVVSGQTESEAQEYLKSIPDIPNAEVLPHQGQYGIFAGSYATQAEARTAAADLATNAGLVRPNVVFFPTGVPSLPGATSGGEGRFRVLIGQFDNIADARDRQSRLQAKGLFSVDILEQNGIHRLFAGFELPTRAEAERYAATLRELDVLYDRIVDLSEPIAAPTPDLDSIAQGYLGRFDNAIAANNFTEAERLLNEWEGLDPGNLQIPAKRQELLRARENFATPVPTPLPTAEPTPQQSEFDLRRPDALAAEEQGRLEEAIAIWERLLAAPTLTEAQATEARSSVNRLKQQLYADVSEVEPPAEPSGNMLLYIIIGVVVLLVVIAVVVIMKKKKSAPAPTPSVAPTPIKPMAPAKPVLASPPPPANPPPAKKTTATEIPSTERIVPPVPQALEETQVDFGNDQPDTVALSDNDDDGALLLDGILGGDDSPEEPPTKVDQPAAPQPPPPSRVVPSDDNRRIPTIREDKTAPIIAGAPPPPKPAPVPAPVAPAASAQPAAPKPAPVKAGPVSSTPGRVAFYEQSFDDEEVGAMPANWTGEYDYATLKIVEREEGSGKKCMRFEKQSGSGSAFYTCKFPDAAGRVVVEFDLRCDNKNKYLLGFYIEKDGDFRHSMHTVVHRDVANMDKISLRLQNESEPYTLGEWVHIRFLIDLPRNIVDGYMNDRPVAVGVRLASKPRIINTLSIRDNLATEGILMIDNIQIYQDRPA